MKKEKGVSEGVKSDVALRQARQSAYRARQQDVLSLLIALWRLRRSRERGQPLALVLMPVQGRWDLLAELVRELIHEEGVVAKATEGLIRGALPEGASAGGQPGLSTAQISTTEEKGSSTTTVQGRSGGIVTAKGKRSGRKK